MSRHRAEVMLMIPRATWLRSWMRPRAKEEITTAAYPAAFALTMTLRLSHACAREQHSSACPGMRLATQSMTSCDQSRGARVILWDMMF